MDVKIIDFNAKNAAQEFALGLKDIGFAVITHHPIPVKLINEAYEKWYAFFKSSERDNFLFNKETHDGYVSPNLSEIAKGYTKKDLKEFYHFYTWGRCPEST